MARAMVPSQQKVAEKLNILNDRGIGMLTRIYNIKKACQDAKSKPSFLSEKSLESTLKQIVRKFPNIDSKNLQAISSIRTDIIKSLSLYYFTFVDLLDFKDHVCEVLTTIDALQMQLDITLNFDLTKGYLDLVTTYVTLMILLSRVDDRKAVLGLFNGAHEQAHGQTDPSFPRLGQMIIEYDPPLKKLAEEFIPHAKVLYSALHSLKEVFPRRNLSADQWRTGKMLSLTANPAQMLNPAQTDTMPCEYHSLVAMERWIIVSCLLCHQYLTQPVAMDLWSNALQSSWVMTLFRDETIYIHAYVQSFFESLKGYGKRISEVKDCYSLAVTNAGHMHRERRKFLRSALKDLGLILHDQPGLLGPKALFVLMGLCFARDEVLWLLRHNENPPLRTNKGKMADELTDRQLPELLFEMEVLRGLVRKYNQVLQRYYVQYLSGYDATALALAIQQLQVCPEDENVILSSICSTVSNLNVKQVEESDLFDFRGLRLDWYRLQAYTSATRTPLRLVENRELANLLNTITFHTKMVDYLDKILVETSDLSIFCFFNRLFEDHFKMCLEFPAQNRYIICFPLICGHFQNCTHELCPEERHHIRERSLSVVNMYLDEMAKEAKNIIATICDEHCTLSDKLLPKHCARMIVEAVNKKKKEKSKKSMSECDKPGQESYRRTREELTIMDKLHMALTELCYAINYCSTIHVWEYTFAPREYLNQHLESRFARALVGMVMFNQETNEIAKPSELLVSVRAYMSILQSVENHVHVDMTRIFNSVLLQQTQQLDGHGEKTVTALYTAWYSDVLLRRVSVTHGNICYSPIQRVFVSLQAEPSLPVSAEEYTDVGELRALAELVGPYGMKILGESLLWLVANQILELRKLVTENREILIALRTNFDKPETMRELTRKLPGGDTVLQRMAIVGVILNFRELCQSALNDVLTERIPFLLSSVADFQQHVPVNGDSLLESTRLKMVSEMSAAAGLPCKVDPVLVTYLKQHQKSDSPEEEYLASCLLMVYVAVSLPRLARSETSHYRPALEAHANNSHCLATAINGVFAALFSLTGHGDIEDRLKEFLALASSSLLRLGQEHDKEVIRERESIYLLLDLITQKSPFLSMDLMESCFPYTLLRTSYHAVYKGDQFLTS